MSDSEFLTAQIHKCDTVAETCNIPHFRRPCVFLTPSVILEHCENRSELNCHLRPWKTFSTKGILFFVFSLKSPSNEVVLPLPVLPGIPALANCHSRVDHSTLAIHRVKSVADSSAVLCSMSHFVYDKRTNDSSCDEPLRVTDCGVVDKGFISAFS